MGEFIDSLLASREGKIAIVVVAVVIFILFLALLNRLEKAKCPKCKGRKCKEISSTLISERRIKRTRTVNGQDEEYYVDVGTYDVTYECKKCGKRFQKRIKRDRKF